MLDHPLQCAIAHNRAVTTAAVTKWHSKFHATARGIEATPLKKWMILVFGRCAFISQSEE
jgi:hypothetical protein